MNREQQLALIDNEQTKIELRSQSERLNVHEKRIEDLEDLRNIESRFLLLNQEVAKWVRQYAEALDEFRWRREDQNRKINQLSAESIRIGHDTQAQMALISSVHEEIEKIKSSLSQNQKNLEENITNRCANVLETSNAHLEKVKAELVVSPAQILENNNEIKRKVEIALIDSNTAILKSTNLESMFKVIDRKIENLSQLIKKLELERPT